MPSAIYADAPTCAPNLETACVTLHLRPHPAPVRLWHARRPGLPGLVWGRTPRVLGTLNPTSPLRRRRRYLATAWVRGAGKYADRLGAAPRLIRASLGRSGRVSFKQPQSNNHSGRQQGLGLWIGCNPGWRAVAGKQLQQWLFVGWRVGSPAECINAHIAIGFC